MKRAELEALLDRIAVGDEEALETLLAFLETRSAGTRVLFLEALAIQDAEQMWEAIMLTLADDDLPAVAPLAEAEAEPEPPRAPPDVVDALLHGPTRQARLEAARALAEWRDPHTVKPLVETFRGDRLVAGAAVEALVEIGAPAVPALIEALRDREAQVRWHAAKALSRLGDVRAAEALIERLDDPNYGVRWLAAEGLVAIGVAVVEMVLEALCTRRVGAWFRHGVYHVLNKVEAPSEAEKAWLRQLAARVRRDPADELPLLARRALTEWRAGIR